MTNPSFNDDARIRGDTDETLIGNIGDRLKVTNVGAGNPGGPVSTSKYRIEHDSLINIPVGYATMYTYSGSGLFYGCYLDFSNKNVVTRLTIDGEQIFDLDLSDATAGSDDWCGLGVNGSDDILKFCPSPYPILYETSVLIECRRTTAPDKAMQNLLVWISQET